VLRTLYAAQMLALVPLDQLADTVPRQSQGKNNISCLQAHGFTITEAALSVGSLLKNGTRGDYINRRPIILLSNQNYLRFLNNKMANLHIRTVPPSQLTQSFSFPPSPIASLPGW
jgi:hypothetical protein